MSIGLTTVVQKLPSSINNAGGSAYSVNGKYPKLALDFVNNYYRAEGLNKFSDVVTHSRAGNATMVASDGLIKWAPHNLLTYSSEFDNAAWDVGGVTVVPDDIAAPDGTVTADVLKGTGTTAQHFLRQSIGFISGTVYTLSCYIKKNTVQHVVLYAFINSSNNAGAGFDLDAETATAGEVGTGYSATNAQITSVGNGWFRCSVEVTIGSTAAAQFRIGTRNSAYTSGTFYSFYEDAITDETYIWGAHVYRSDLGGMAPVPAGERSFPSASTYVPTTSSARYLPRVGHHVYNGSAWVNEGVLAESEARTNLITYSEDFSTNWNFLNTATLVADATGPDGKTSATTLVDDNSSGGGAVSIYDTLTVNTDSTYTLSLFAKKDQLEWLSLRVRNFTSVTDSTAFFNLNDGSLGTAGAGLTSQIESYGNGWYRCSVSFLTDSSDVSGEVRIQVAEADNDSGVDLDGTSSILIYGAQFEQGSTPSSYIPTAGSTVTRAAETFTIPAANLPYNSTALSTAIQGRVTYADTNNNSEAVVVNWAKNASNYFAVSLSTDSTRTGDFRFAFRSNGGSTESHFSTSNYTPGIFVPFNVAVRASGLTNYINIAADGVAVTQEAYTGTGMPDLSATDLDLAYDYMGTVERFRVWGVDLGDGGIELASAPSLEPSLSLTFDSSESSFVVDDWSA